MFWSIKPYNVHANHVFVFCRKWWRSCCILTTKQSQLKWQWIRACTPQLIARRNGRQTSTDDFSRRPKLPRPARASPGRHASPGGWGSAPLWLRSTPLVDGSGRLQLAQRRRRNGLGTRRRRQRLEGRRPNRSSDVARFLPTASVVAGRLVVVAVVGISSRRVRQRWQPGRRDGPRSADRGRSFNAAGGVFFIAGCFFQ